MYLRYNILSKGSENSKCDGVWGWGKHRTVWQKKSCKRVDLRNLLMDSVVLSLMLPLFDQIHPRLEKSFPNLFIYSYTPYYKSSLSLFLMRLSGLKLGSFFFKSSVCRFLFLIIIYIKKKKSLLNIRDFWGMTKKSRLNKQTRLFVFSFLFGRKSWPRCPWFGSGQYRIAKNNRVSKSRMNDAEKRGFSRH